MRRSQLDQVGEFHSAFGLPARAHPQEINDAETALRINLIKEECEEAIEAMQFGEDLEHIAKELADILYVVNGAALHYGIDLDRVFDEVHRSNMTKLWPCDACDGRGVVDENGNPYVWGRTDSNDCCICDGRGKYVKYRESDGKVLKSPDYTQPDLSRVI